MLDEEKLEDYVESFYGLAGKDYRVDCVSGEGFFQINIRHLDDEEPELEKVIDNIFRTLALDDEDWDLNYIEKNDYSSVESSKKYLEKPLMIR